MRSKSIVNFERVVLLGILVSIVNTWLTMDKAVAMTQARLDAQGNPFKVGAGMFIGVEVAIVIITLLLVWLISRKASLVAKWIYVVLSALFLIAAVFGIATGKMAAYGTVPFVMGIVQNLLTLASLWLIFQPDAKAWFSEGRGPDPASLS
jgi:hypothetical protein